MAPFTGGNSAASPIVALLTDFGWRDGYVGAMKGVILGINPRCQVVDVAHELDPHDIMAGALVLEGVFSFFPEGTVFVAVVDPGVGGKRKPLAVEVEGRFLVGPDNGLFTLVLQGKAFHAFEIRKKRFVLPRISSTFHGRDIFAPVAAYLSLGVRPEELGPELPGEELVSLAIPAPTRDERGTEGEVIYVDRFGNLVTNLRPEDMPSGEPLIEVEGVQIKGVKTSYEEAERGQVLAIWGSSGRLELSMRERPLKEETGWGVGTKVRVR